MIVGCDAQRPLVRLPAEDHLIGVDQPADAPEVLFVDHVHIAVADERVFADHALNLRVRAGAGTHP